MVLKGQPKIDWTKKEIGCLKTNYPHTPAKTLTHFLPNRSIFSIEIKVRRLKIEKEKNFRYKPITLEKQHKQILLGSLLGDASVYCTFNHPNHNAHFTETHSIKEKKYLLWKLRILKQKFKIYNNTFITTLKNGKSYNEFAIHSGRHPIFTELRKEFYPKDKKIVTQKILNQLTPLGLAVWYCDDGHYADDHKDCSLNTQKYTLPKVKIIQKYFKEKWGINCRLQKMKLKNSIGYRIQFYVKDANKFLILIKPFFTRYKIPKIMWYKLGHLWKGNTKRIKEAHKQKLKQAKKYSSKPKVKKRNRLNEKIRKNELKKLKICLYCKKARASKGLFYCRRCLEELYSRRRLNKL